LIDFFRPIFRPGAKEAGKPASFFVYNEAHGRVDENAEQDARGLFFLRKEIVCEEGMLLGISHLARWAILGLVACAAVLFLVCQRFSGELDDWRHRFPETMLSIAKAQLQIEEQLKHHVLIGAAPLRLDPHSVSYSYVLRGGSIVVAGAEGRFFLVFEPSVHNDAIEWACQGMPDSLFRPDRPGAIGDCGLKYRDIVRDTTSR
jgi:hypothetical protein